MNGKRFVFSDELSAEDIKDIRGKLGLTQIEFADLINVSVKTIERWEQGDKAITGPVVPLVRLFHEYPQFAKEFCIPKKEFPLRLWYMFRNEVCTIIDVDEHKRKVRITNYSKNLLFRAFGKNQNPTYEDYESFLESRCFPRTRDKMKIVLKELDLPFYDPFLIVEKTKGRMAEDDFWIRIER